MNEEFKKQLFDAAASRLRQRSTPMTFLISNILRETIEEGVRNMGLHEIDDPLKRKIAETNLIKLVDTFMNKSLNEGLQTRTFSNAKTSICPLWPFC